MTQQDSTNTITNLKFKPVFIIVSSQVLLLFLLYYGSVGYFNAKFSQYFDKNGEYYRILPYIYWFGMSIFTRSVIPILLIWFVLKDKLRNFGYSFKGTSKLSYVYVMLGVAMIPLVIYASSLDTFQAKYPLCSGLVENGVIHWKLLVIYEISYIMMFASGESFWRGYMIFGLKDTFGNYALFVMVIPYSMGHFGVLTFGYTGKPFLETMGSIVAGLVLGFLALKHESFWLGVALHWFVALSMDTMVIYRVLN